MRDKEQILLEQAYLSVKESSGTYDGNRLASDAKHFSKAGGPQGLSGPEDHDFLKHKNSAPSDDSSDGETKAKIVLANITDDLDDLRLTLQKLYGGPHMDLDQRVEDIFDRIDARIESVVPTQDY